MKFEEKTFVLDGYTVRPFIYFVIEIDDTVMEIFNFKTNDCSKFFTDSFDVEKDITL